MLPINLDLSPFGLKWHNWLWLSREPFVYTNFKFSVTLCGRGTDRYGFVFLLDFIDKILNRLQMATHMRWRDCGDVKRRLTRDSMKPTLWRHHFVFRSEPTRCAGQLQWLTSCRRTLESLYATCEFLDSLLTSSAGGSHSSSMLYRPP